MDAENHGKLLFKIRMILGGKTGKPTIFGVPSIFRHILDDSPDIPGKLLGVDSWDFT